MTLSTTDLGSAIDALYNLREMRLGYERKAKELKQQETEARNAILATLEASGLQKASGQQATCGIKTSIIPLVTDWDDIFTYIKDHDRFDLIQKRISVLAWRETYENEGLIPGTEAVEDVDISLTKSSRS
jgi:hypothetical protein